jgi:uncharacterized secreted protein with C-terminal beta-propeller domain
MFRFKRKVVPVILGIAILSSLFNFTVVLGQTATPGTAAPEPMLTSADAAPFPDITTENINYDAISYLKTNGIIEGYPDGTYKPEGEINRAEFTKIIVGAFTKNPTGNNCFTDVKDEWFAKYICEAKTRKIVSGYDDGSYKPSDRIKFSEASKIIANSFGLSSTESDPNVWYKKYITALSDSKDIPLSVEYFDEFITRDEMAEMIWRIKADVKDKVTRSYDEISGSGLVSGNTCAELQQRFAETNRYPGGDIMYKDAMPMINEAVGAPAPAMAPQAATGAESAPADMSGASGSYSTTNIQVDGVDEADVVKNDGKYIYLVKGSTVRIIQAYPADSMKELVTLTLGDKNETFTPSELYINGDQMTVIGSVYKSYSGVTDSSTTTSSSPALDGVSSKMIAPYPYYNNQRTKVYILDIKDRAKAVVSRWVEFDGDYTTSRRIGNTMYLVLNKYVYFPPIYRIMEDSAGATDTTTQNVDPATLVPQMMDSKTNKDEPVSACTDIRLVPKSHSNSYLITAAIPLNDLTKSVSRSVVIGSAQNVYASTNNLYIASTDWSGGFYKAEGYNMTSLYKFALADGKIEYSGNGSVPGTVLNQYSMDENNTYFRLATTKQDYAWGKSSNAVYVLDKNMKQVGSIDDIAPGESIYSARFMGNRAYLVTFKQIDPLFVIDLKEPNAPRILGKLKIPGYSTYLHPYDENHIMGFGNEVDASIDADLVHSEDAVYYTAVQGMKLGMFDVTDVSHPKEMFKEVIGDRGTTSELLTNPKALLFDKATGLLAFPVTIFKIPGGESCYKNTYSTCSETAGTCRKICVPSSCSFDNGLQICTADCDGPKSCVATDTYGKPTFDGAYVYNVNLTKGFELKGKVSHYTADEQGTMTSNGYSNWEKTIQRVIYIGENLYSISRSMVKANLLTTLAELKAITLAGDSSSDYPIPMPMI